MEGPAKVQSSDALLEAKAALQKFAEDAKAALTAVDADIARFHTWLNTDRVGHWSREIRKRNEEINQAKAAIMRKQLSAAPNPASVVDERKALDRAKRRLEDAERRLASTKRWAVEFEKSAMLCRGSMSSVSEYVYREIPNATGRLERMLGLLEGYAAISAGVPAGGGGDSGSRNLQSMTRARDAVASDGGEGETSLFVFLRAGVPDGPSREVVTDRGGEQLLRGIPLREDDVVAVGAMSRDWPVPSPDQRVVVAANVREADAIFLARTEGSGGNDSGWYIGPVATGAAAGMRFVLTVREVVKQRPDLEAMLSMPAGTLAVLSGGRVQCVLDDVDVDQWRAETGGGAA